MIAAVEGSNILCDVSHPFITLAMNFLLSVSLLLFSLKYSMIAFFRSTSFDQFFRLDKEDTSFYIYLPSYCTWYLYLHIHNIFTMFMSDFSQLPVLSQKSFIKDCHTEYISSLICIYTPRRVAEGMFLTRPSVSQFVSTVFLISATPLKPPNRIS